MKQFHPSGLLYQYQLMIVGTRLQPKMGWSPLIACTMAGVSSASSSSYHHSQHRGKNTTACLQNTVARRSDFKMLLTNVLFIF